MNKKAIIDLTTLDNNQAVEASKSSKNAGALATGKGSHGVVASKHLFTLEKEQGGQDASRII
ncbi:hypothetical protein PaeBR_20830 [Paenibacillus sp. BR2-3]|uniref:hypothetical protein n=1 Tax=Paenibacillus sp. BR2-3 TaxID=3048494 RepID=UPI00397733E9